MVHTLGFAKLACLALAICLLGCEGRRPNADPSQLPPEADQPDSSVTDASTPTAAPDDAAMRTAEDGPTPQSPAAAGDEFETQFAAVQSGQSATLRLTLQPITPEQLKRLAKLPGLLDLLLDAGGVDDNDLALVGQWGQLEHLRIRESTIGNAGLAKLCEGGMPNLAILNLPHTQLTSAGLEALAKLPKLEQLRLGGQQIDDAAVASIARLPHLKSLHLIGPSLTGAALESLAAAPRLASLYLDDCPLDDTAWQALFDAKPNIHVHVDQQHHDRDPANHKH